MSRPIDKAKLRRSTLDLIARIHAIHTAGEGTVPLAELVQLFSLPDAEAPAARRGGVIFEPVDAGGGVFLNDGPPLQFNSSGLAIEIPPLLRGQYEVSAHRLVLRFDPVATITGKKLFIRASLSEVVADANGIDVNISGPIPLPTRIRFDE